MEEACGGGSCSDVDARTCPRGHWRPAEDEKLRRLVEQYGPQNWNSIAEKLQGRSGMYFSPRAAKKKKNFARVCERESFLIGSFSI